MPYARHYDAFEIRALLQYAEGRASPVTGAAAHSRGLHARQTPGGTGVSEDGMNDRTHQRTGESNTQFKKRGKPQTSAFTSLVSQAEAATQALNSTTGQTALAEFDKATNAGLKVRVVMEIAGIQEASFLRNNDPDNLPIGLLVSKKTDTAGPVRKAAFKDALRGVMLIVDCVPGQTCPNIFIQTCYPLTDTITENYKVSLVA